jgi:hypothetical protein
MSDDAGSRNTVQQFLRDQGWTAEQIEAFRQVREASKRYEERHGPPPRLACPLCATPTRFSLYLPTGRSLADLRGEIAEVEPPGEAHTIFWCPNGHRWRMRGRMIDGGTIWDRWDPIDAIAEAASAEH